MPLEALIDPETGDVIVVKPQGSVWGRCEVNAVVLIGDAVLEARLLRGGLSHVIYPYAVREKSEQLGPGTRAKPRALREVSRVKVAVADAAAMKVVSRKPGVLRAADADRPIQAAVVVDRNREPAVGLPEKPLAPLEALVDPETGDVIVVKPRGSVWGRCEVDAVVLLDDPALEAQLAERGQPHVVYPYAAYEERRIEIRGRQVRRRRLLDRSLVKVAVTDAPAMRLESTEAGLLRATRAVAARIAEVRSVPTPGQRGEVQVAQSLPTTQKP